MPKTTSLPSFVDQDAFIIGGGPSLRTFDWRLLKGKNTIGCNQAFLLGPDVCSICTWGDFNFWCEYKKRLAEYGGFVATNYLLDLPGTPITAPDWLKYFPRIDWGLSTGPELGWNSNTGCLSINLALILGARRVFLLGVDLGGGTVPGNTHWHNESKEVQNLDNFSKFQDGYSQVASELPTIFPGREVINVSDGSSRLRGFPTCGFSDIGLAKVSEAA